MMEFQDTRPTSKEALEDLPKAKWIEVPFEECPHCGGELIALTRAGTEGWFYDEDPVRCIGKCQKEIGLMACDGECASVSPYEEVF